MEIKKKFGLQDLYVKLAAWEDLLVEPACFAEHENLVNDACSNPYI